MKPVNKILIIRLSSIGDIILTTPLLRSIRNKFPEVQIDFIIKKEFSDILKYNNFIDHLIGFDKNTGFPGLKILKKRIKSEKYDLLIDLHNSLRSNYLKLFSGIPVKTTYSKKLLERFLLVRLGKNIYSEIKPVYLRYFESVRKFNIRYDDNGTDVIVIQDIKNAIKEKLAGDAYDFQKPLVVICPGASYSNKRWLPEGFSAIASDLFNKNNAFIAFLGGKQDRELCRQIIEKSGINAMNYAGRFRLAESAALLKEATLVISNDSGMMHLAQAVKTPVVAIFGPTSRELGFFPLPEKSMVIEKKLSCRPCTFKGLNHCPEKHFQCMKSISAAEIYEAAVKMLG